LAEVRALIEVPVMMRLARTVSASRWAELRPLAEATVRAAVSGCRATYAESDRAFHRAVLALAGNEQLVGVAEDLHRRAQWPLVGGGPDARHRGELVADAHEHTVLLDALIAGDLDVVSDLGRQPFTGSAAGPAPGPAPPAPPARGTRGVRGRARWAGGRRCSVPGRGPARSRRPAAPARACRRAIGPVRPCRRQAIAAPVAGGANWRASQVGMLPSSRNSLRVSARRRDGHGPAPSRRVRPRRRARPAATAVPPSAQAAARPSPSPPSGRRQPQAVAAPAAGGDNWPASQVGMLPSSRNSLRVSARRREGYGPAPSRRVRPRPSGRAAVPGPPRPPCRPPPKRRQGRRRRRRQAVV